MKNNIEQMPSEIFDWINSFSFDELNEEQKFIVLSFLTKDEYNDLYNAAINIENVIHKKSNKESIKKSLFEEFETKKKVQNFDSSILWKAAAILLFITTSYLIIMNKQNKIQSEVVSVKNVKHDTLIVEKLVEIRDTITKVENQVKQIIDKKINTFIAKSNQTKSVESKKIIKNVTNVIAFNDSSIKVISVDQLNSISNSCKRNSRKFDSIETNFQFVSL